jgi:outer membrane protein
MKRAFVLLSLLAAALAFPRAAVADPLTLRTVLDRVDAQSPRPLAGEAARDAAAAGVASATASMLPTFTVSETYLRTNDPVGVFSAKLDQGKFTADDFALPNLNHPGSINNWMTRAELAVPVFKSGVDWAERRAAKEVLTATDHATAFERAQARLAAMKLYFTAVSLEAQIGAIREGMQRLRALEGGYQPAEAATSASTTNLLVVRSVRENLEADAVRLGCERTKALHDLNAVMGDDPATPLVLADPLPPISEIEMEGSSASQAPALRADVAASAASVRATAAERQAALRRWGPDVHLVGAYNLSTGDFEDAGRSYEVGARLSWPLLDMSRQAEIDRTKARAQEAAHLHRASELAASSDLASAEARLRSCIERMRIVSKAQATAAEAMAQGAIRYQEGSLPLMDYSQAIQNWVRMRLASIENHLGAAVAKAELDFHRGAL